MRSVGRNSDSVLRHCRGFWRNTVIAYSALHVILPLGRSPNELEAFLFSVQSSSEPPLGSVGRRLPRSSRLTVKNQHRPGWKPVDRWLEVRLQNGAIRFAIAPYKFAAGARNSDSLFRHSADLAEYGCAYSP
jgi:hypothetical protein